MTKTSPKNSSKTLAYAIISAIVVLSLSVYLSYPIADSPILPNDNSVISLKVDPKFTDPSIHRLGLNWTALNEPLQGDQAPSAATPSNSHVYNLPTDTLKAFNPSVLRYEISPTAPLPNQAHTDLLDATVFTTTLPEFLNLCLQIGANPWIAVPNGLTQNDIHMLGEFLAQHATTEVFSEVLIEFIGSNSTETSSADSHPPQNSSEDNSQELLAELAQIAGPQVHLSASPAQDHSLDSNSDPSHVAQSILNKILQHFTFPLVLKADSDAHTPDTQIYTASLLNQVLGGSLHPIHIQAQPQASPANSTENLTLAAFRSGNEWAAAIVSARSTPTSLTLEFPEDDRSLPATALTLSLKPSEKIDGKDTMAPSIAQTAIQAEQRKVTLHIPAHSLVVIKP